jgi:hypothetical protein
LEDLRSEEDPGPAVLAAALATLIPARQDKPHCLALRVDRVCHQRRRYGKALVVIDQLPEILLFLLLLLDSLIEFLDFTYKVPFFLMLFLSSHK